MSSPPEKDHPKLVMLGMLHMAQYFPAAFTGIALPFLFRKEGLPLEMFWLLALPAIPRWLKWLIALVVDNYGSARIGQRKSWIIPCTAIGAAAYAALAWIPPTVSAVHVIVGILLAKSFIMAAQDIAVDGYAAESMTNAERATGTSIIGFLGTLANVSGKGVVTLVEAFGWFRTMLAASALMIVFATPGIIRREPPPPAATRQRRARGERASLVKALRRRESRYILPYLSVFGFGAGFFGSMLGPFFADEGLTTTQFGILFTVATLAGSGLGALVTPWLVERIGMRRTAIIGVVALPVEGCIFGALALYPGLPALPTLTFIVAVLGFVTSIYSYVVNNSRFRWASKAQAATDYSMQSSLWNFGLWAAGSASGFVVADVGWAIFFPIAGCLAGAGGVAYIALFNRIEAMVQRRERDELEGGVVGGKRLRGHLRPLLGQVANELTGPWWRLQCHHVAGSDIMIRTQIQLTDEQLTTLRALARQEDRSVADLVRQSVAEYLVRRPRIDRAERVRRARSLVGRYRSDCPDLAEHHDRHLDDAFDL